MWANSVAEPAATFSYGGGSLQALHYENHEIFKENDSWAHRIPEKIYRDTMEYGSFLETEKPALPQEHSDLSLLHQLDNAILLPPREHPQIPADRYESLLQHCGSENYLPLGRKIHALMVEDGHDRDKLLCNLLIRMYGKCQSLMDAIAFFSGMRRRNVFTWAILIGILVDHGHMHDAIFALQQMLLENVLPDKAIFVAVLSACASPDTLPEGRRMHAFIVASCFLPDVVVGTALLSMYCKFKHLDHAQLMFVDMPARNVVSWNAMIAAYVEHGLSINVPDLIAQMQAEGVLPDEVTFVSILNACAAQGALGHGKQIHVPCWDAGLASNVIVGTALINMYGKCGDLDLANKVFEQLVVRDVVSWSAMISAYVQHGLSEGAMQLFQQMELEGMIPNLITASSVLDSCTISEEVKRLHAYIVGYGFVSDTAVENALLKIYGKCGDLLSTQKLFDRMMQRNVVSWTEMIKVCLDQGQGKDALKHYGQMLLECVLPDYIALIGMLDACSSQEALPQGKQLHSWIMGIQCENDTAVRIALVNFYTKCSLLSEARRIVLEASKQDVVTWSCLIKAYAEHKPVEQVFCLFGQMEGGVIPDRVCVVSVLDVCACHAALAEGKRMHYWVMDMCLERDLVVGTALVTMYGKCGSLKDAQVTFDGMPEHNAVTWNAIIGAHSQHGHVKQTLYLFEQMQKKSFTPDGTTYLNILSACRYAGLLDEGCQLFLSMCQVHNIKLTVDHFNCMVDLVARVGLLDEGEGMIESMPCNPNGTTWMTLLGACKKHLDIKRGTGAAEHVLKLDSMHASPYVLLSNIYAASQKWDEVVKLRNLMKEMNIGSAV